MAYINGNLTVTEVLRLHGDELPAQFRPIFERMADCDVMEERIMDLEFMLDHINDLIVASNWRTGKKAELQELISAIQDATDYNEKLDGLQPRIR